MWEGGLAAQTWISASRDLNFFHIKSLAWFSGLKKVRVRMPIPLTRRNVEYE